MAVPSSGNSISMQNIAKELKLDNYYGTGPTFTDVSLTEMSTGTGDFSTEPINTDNPVADRPDGSTPHSMAEFHSYDHDIYSSGQYLVWSRSGGTTSSTNKLFTDPNHASNTDPVVNPYGTGSDTRWRRSYFDLSPYQGRTIRLIIGFYHATYSFKCDTALMSWRIETNNDSVYDHEYEFANQIAYTDSTNENVNTIETVYSGLDVSTVKFRNIVTVSEQDYTEQNIMQQHTGSYNANDYQSTTGWVNFTNSYNTSTGIISGNQETTSNTSGQWNYYLGGETPSSNTGPLNTYVYWDLNVNNEYYEPQNMGFNGDPNWGYLYYEASNMTSARHSWMRTVQIEVPENALNLHFIYSAFSNDITNWYNCVLKIYVDLD
jgi:hypothetical protein